MNKSNIFYFTTIVNTLASVLLVNQIIAGTATQLDMFLATFTVLISTVYLSIIVTDVYVSVKKKEN